MSAAAHSHDSPIAVVIARLPKAKKSGAGWVAPCPAHEDSNPSLSISVGDDGRCLLKCHAGCDVVAIVAALGLTEADLFPPKASAQRTGAKQEIVATYDYHDEKGNVRFQVVRLYPPKDFRQRQRVGDEWVWKMTGIDRLLYHLPEVLEARAEGRVVFLVEGEKDADNMRALGFMATTNPGGAKKWLPQYTDTLTGADVVIVPDNDRAGTGHRDLVASKLDGFAKVLRVMDVPLPHKDISDWIVAGATAEDIKARALATPLYVAPAEEPASAEPGPAADGEPPTPATKAKRFPMTDIGNAERLIARHGRDVRYVTEWKSWMVWDERRWLRDRTHEVERRAKDTVRGIPDETKSTLLNAEQRDKLVNFAKKSEANASVNNMLSRARAEPGIAITTEALDAHPWLMNLKNGTLDLRSAKLLPHDRSHLMTKLVPIDYDPDATCPLWLAFLARIMNENETLIEYLQMAIGYALTGMTTEQCFFLLYGSGANGKTTFIEILGAIAGDYGTQADFRTFIEAKTDRGPRDDVAELFGARVVTAVEVGEGKRFNESLVKSLTGSDTVRARFLYESAFQFQPQFKLFLAGNHKPQIRGTDEGIWRRVRLIPFTVHIPAAEQDKDLPAKLRQELPGILAWAVTGCQLWLERDGLGMPAEVRAAGDSYRAESDTLGAFLEEYCELGKEFKEPSKTLYDAFAQWAREGGEYQLSQTAFGRRLEERGITAEKMGSNMNRKVWRLGIRLVVRPSGSSGRNNEPHPADRDDDSDPLLFS